jgi:hypothetical protein
MTDQIKAAFVAMTGVPDAWTNPALMQTRNGFIQGWEAGVSNEREACAKVCEQVGQDWNYHGIAAAIRARGNE